MQLAIIQYIIITDVFKKIYSLDKHGSTGTFHKLKRPGQLFVRSDSFDDWVTLQSFNTSMAAIIQLNLIKCKQMTC